MEEFRKSAGATFGMPLPTFMAKIGSFVKNVDSSLLLETVPVTTILTLKNGFQFNFPYIQPALNQLIKSST
jgi:NAD dependent epimerase/dehydratase family enzyme